jgi:hypothetical protein
LATLPHRSPTFQFAIWSHAFRFGWSCPDRGDRAVPFPCTAAAALASPRIRSNGNVPVSIPGSTPDSVRSGLRGLHPSFGADAAVSFASRGVASTEHGLRGELAGAARPTLPVPVSAPRVARDRSPFVRLRPVLTTAIRGRLVCSRLTQSMFRSGGTLHDLRRSSSLPYVYPPALFAGSPSGAPPRRGLDFPFNTVGPHFAAPPVILEEGTRGILLPDRADGTGAPVPKGMHRKGREQVANTEGHRADISCASVRDSNCLERASRPCTQRRARSPASVRCVCRRKALCFLSKGQLHRPIRRRPRGGTISDGIEARSARAARRTDFAVPIKRGRRHWPASPQRCRRRLCSLALLYCVYLQRTLCLLDFGYRPEG